jgi:hypothetical protein
MLTPTTKNLLGSALYCSKSNEGNRTKRNTSPIAGASTSSRRRPHHAQRYRTTMPRICRDEKHCILYFSKRAAIVQSTTETAVDYLLRSTSCYTVCRLLSAPLRERKRRLRKSRISSATRKKGRTAPKRIPESLAAQNFHWRCMANTIAKPSLGEHLRDRVTKKYRMIAKSEKAISFFSSLC